MRYDQQKPARSLTLLALLAVVPLALASCQDNNKKQQTESSSEASNSQATAAATPSTPSQPGRRPGAIAVSEVTTGFTVQSIDRANRTVTLKRTDGTLHTYKCGPEVRNFDQVRVGDKVTATVVEQLAVFVRKAGMTSPTTGASASSHGAIALAARGAKPGLVMANTSEVTARIDAVDPANHTVTLRGSDGSSAAAGQQTFTVSPDVDLTGVHVGDDVVVQYTEGLAVVVEDPAAQP